MLSAARGRKIIQGVSSSGQHLSAVYEPLRQEARAEASRIRQEDPHLSMHAVAKKIRKRWKSIGRKAYEKPEKPPSIGFISKWIRDLDPRPKRSI